MYQLKHLHVLLQLDEACVPVGPDKIKNTAYVHSIKSLFSTIRTNNYKNGKEQFQ